MWYLPLLSSFQRNCSRSFLGKSLPSSRLRRIKTSESVPTGQTVEQYILPMKKVAQSHNNKAPMQRAIEEGITWVDSTPAMASWNLTAFKLSSSMFPVRKYAMVAARNITAIIILIILTVRMQSFFFYLLRCAACCSLSICCCLRCISSRRAMNPLFFRGFFAFSAIVFLTSSSFTK